MDVSSSDSISLRPLRLSILCRRTLLQLIDCLLLVLVVGMLLEIVRGVGVVVAAVHAQGGAPVSAVQQHFVASVVC